MLNAPGRPVSPTHTIMFFSTRLRSLPALALLSALAFGLTACDNAMPDPGPDPDPGPAMATVTMNLQNITAVDDCENADDNPGDFHFKIALTDGQNQTLSSVIELPAGTYGIDGSDDNTIQLLDGESTSVGQDASFTLPEEPGSAFNVSLSMIEWDFETAPDADANDVTGTATHEYVAGRFQNIAGVQTVDARGDNGCMARLKYVITVS